MAKPMDINIAQKLEMDFYEPVAATGVPGPAVGLTDVSVRISATKNGAAINPALVYNAAARSGVPHRFFANPPLDDFQQYLAAYEGDDVFIVWEKAGAFEPKNVVRTVVIGEVG